MPFGRHRGVLLTEVPPDYLAWLLGLELREPLRSAVAAEAERRQRNAHTPPAPHTPRLARDALPLAEQIITAGYRSLAQKHHPDRGGETRAMQRLNDAVRWLRHSIAQEESVA
jgi:hypothetical protein